MYTNTGRETTSDAVCCHLCLTCATFLMGVRTVVSCQPPFWFVRTEGIGTSEMEEGRTCYETVVGRFLLLHEFKMQYYRSKLLNESLI